MNWFPDVIVIMPCWAMPVASWPKINGISTHSWRTIGIASVVRDPIHCVHCSCKLSDLYRIGCSREIYMIPSIKQHSKMMIFCWHTLRGRIEWTRMFAHVTTMVRDNNARCLHTRDVPPYNRMHVLYMRGAPKIDWINIKTTSNAFGRWVEPNPFAVATSHIRMSAVQQRRTYVRARIPSHKIQTKTE